MLCNYVHEHKICQDVHPQAPLPLVDLMHENVCIKEKQLIKRLVKKSR